jgi:hypothetical protein
MARQIAKGLTMLMLLLTMALVTAVATANGQSQHKLNARIPFEFIVGDKALAAGQYEVSTVGITQEALAIRGCKSNNSVIRLAMTKEPTENKSARLVFHRYGNTYFLSEVWEGGDAVGRQLRQSGQERAMQRELSRIAAHGRSAYEEVVVLADLR